MNAGLGSQARQWPVTISTFPAKVISPSHRHNTHNTHLTFVSAEVGGGVQLEILVAISKLIKKERYFASHTHDLPSYT